MKSKVKVLFATSNSAKVLRIKRLIGNISVQLLSLADLKLNIDEPRETGRDGIENAEVKSNYYYEKTGGCYPVLAQDDTMFLEGVKECDNPGKDIKEPVIRKFGDANDDNVIKYYSELADKYGGKIPLVFKYGHALATSEGMISSGSELHGWLVSKPNERKTLSYPIADLMMVEVGSKLKYWSDLTVSESVQLDHEIRESVTKLLFAALGRQK